MLKGEWGQTVFAQDNHDLYVLGDIHGDFDVLRKCLEECAQVAQFVWVDHEHTKGKPKWIGGNAYVVLCGDVLDRQRKGAYRDEKGWGGGEYSDEEYDILLYLTILNRQAIKEGGRVFAIWGNHEANAILQKDYSYASPGIVRKNRERDMAVPNGRLTQLLRECCAYGLLQIGDWVFVHGGLLPSIINKVVDPDHPIDSTNNFFTRITEAVQYTLGQETERSKSEKHTQKLRHILKHAFLPHGKQNARDSDSFLWNDSVSAEDKKVDCDAVKDALKAFVPHIRALGFSVNPDRLHIVVGHSTQTYQQDGYVFTHKNRKLSDRKRIVLQGPAVHYKQNEKKEEKERRYLGINFNCTFEKDADDGRVWRVDACMSRAFDFTERFKQHMKQGEKDFKRYIFARQPQVLYVNAKTGKVQVIVSRDGPDRSGICKELGIQQSKKISDSEFKNMYGSK